MCFLTTVICLDSSKIHCILCRISPYMITGSLILHFRNRIFQNPALVIFVVLKFGMFSQPCSASGILAYGTSSGAIGTIRITQRLVKEAGPTPFGPGHDIETSVQHFGVVFQPDKAGITAMRWVEFAMRPVSSQLCITLHCLSSPLIKLYRPS